MTFYAIAQVFVAIFCLLLPLMLFMLKELDSDGAVYVSFAVLTMVIAADIEEVVIFPVVPTYYLSFLLRDLACGRLLCFPSFEAGQKPAPG
jgi:fumarate reductase subunit C